MPMLRQPDTLLSDKMLASGGVWLPEKQHIFEVCVSDVFGTHYTQSSSSAFRDLVSAEIPGSHLRNPAPRGPSGGTRADLRSAPPSSCVNVPACRSGAETCVMVTQVYAAVPTPSGRAVCPPERRSAGRLAGAGSRGGVLSS